MRIARLYLFFMLYLVFRALPGCTQNISFTRVTPPKKYPYGLITGITQDTLGYMWFTSGPVLYRYNGYEFTTYKNDPDNPNSLAGGWLETVYADKSGFIWVGTYGHGLDRLDPQTGIFTHFPYKQEDTASLSNNFVTAIIGDQEGIIWVGTQNGLNRLDQKTGKFTRYRQKANDPGSLSNDEVRSLYVDQSGTIWIGTGSTFFSEITVIGEGGLNRFDRKTGKFIRYLHDPKDPHSLIDNRVRAICEDSRGVFWVGTAGDGLHTMDRTKGTFERHLYDPAHPEKLSRPPLKKYYKWGDDHITFIKEDATGAIWVGTFEGGLNRYDPKTGQVSHYESKNDPGSFHENGNWIMYSSREGVVWMSSWEDPSYNLYTIDPIRKNIPHLDVGSSVQAFHEDASAKLWLGTTQGLILTDRNKKIIKLFNHDSLNKSSLSDNNVRAIKEDRKGTLWIGTQNGGLNAFNPQTQTFSHYKNDPNNNGSLTKGDILAILEDRQGLFWIGTSAGLDLMNRQTGLFTHYRYNPEDARSLSNNTVSYICEDRSGELWIGTGNGGGLNRMNRSTGKFKHYLNGTNITCIYEDTDGTIWAGTINGLYRHNKSSGVFSLYKDPAYSIETANITGIAEDDQKNLWISTLSGILRINLRRNETSVYGLNRGVNANTLNYLAGYKLHNGELLLGDATGYYAFFPGDLTGNSKPPQVVITDFKISDQSVKPGGASVLNTVLEQTKKIQLTYKQNVFSFAFVSTHYSRPEDNIHLFMLENYDDSWNRAGSDRRAIYFNVPPGKYVFRVKAANSNGMWAEKSIDIIVTPPWWGGWWFRMTAFICVLAIFYGIIRWRMHQKFRLKLERSEKEKQFAELQHNTAELEMLALRAQMNPEFIFNSLNAINQFILDKNQEQASEYLTKFSKLVRMILQNSQASLITLESELESLELYLDLEALRFEHHFEYKISVPKDLDIEVLKVPPLIIQPYTENAIWHGLMHKEEKGHLEIELFQQDDVLCCKITDDGIGRKKAAELKSKSSTSHKSMGMRITADRIAILQQKKQMDSYITINDLVLPDGSAGGTEVLLKIPVMQ